MTDCILFNSPIHYDYKGEKEEYLPPLGLGYIATQLVEEGVDSEIVDCVKEGIGVEGIKKILKKKQPRYIGFNIFTQNYNIVKELVENCPIKATIFLGGQVIKSIHREVLDWSVKNEIILIIGEGELIFPSLINKTCCEEPTIQNGNKSVYTVDKNSRYFPSNLNEIRIDRNLLQEDIVINHYKQKEASIITSRGCIYDCAFCGGANSLNRDITTRFRQIEDINLEIESIIKNNPDIRSIRVLDDLFLRDKDSIVSAISLFEKFEGLSWRGMAHILTFKNTINLLPELKRSGCRELFVGIESGSEKLRKKINKCGTLIQVEEVVSAILEAGIDVKGYFIYGFPGETTNEAEETYLLAARLKSISKNTDNNFRVSVFQFRPYHGTRLYNEIIQEGIEIENIKSNEVLNVIKGRSQFNFHSGNYSKIETDLLDKYILKTQRLSEE